ncbi:MAG: sensor signal transduction histidine kinase [Nocardioides sp.]|nr:sensor signal transduction histidine kinase [Nocardioides sp.]
MGVGRGPSQPWPWRRTAVVAGTLLTLLVLAWVSSAHAPPRDFVTGMWPVGLGTGAVVLSHPRLRAVTAVLVGGCAALALLLRDASDDIVIGAGIAVALEVYVAARVLRRDDGRRPELRTDEDLRRYFAAAGLAALVGAGSLALAFVSADVGDPAKVALDVGTAHGASHLYLVPFFLRLPEQGAIARRGERVLQWLVLLVGIPLLLTPEASQSLKFLIIPVLAWGALRITPIESLLQLVGVVFLTITLTSYDVGPFADDPERYGLPADYRGVLLSAFAMSCAVIVVPLVLRVGEYVGAARDSARERDLVRGIVDGATGIAIIGTDATGRMTLFNPGAERLLGYRAEEVLGRRTHLLHTTEAVEEKAAELGVEADLVTVSGAIVDRRLVGTPIRFRRKDGSERVHAMTLTRLTVAGTTSGFVSTSEDITDQLDTEQVLRDALEVERHAVERLREVDSVKDQFVSTVSHELRTPITSILGYLEMLADGTLGEMDKPQRDALRRVQSNSHRLLSLIDDLLTLSRVAEDGLRDKETFDLRRSVSTAYEVVSPSWEPPRWLDVTLTLPEEPIETHGNSEMIERLVVNLLSNAVKFTDDGGSVTVSLIVDPGLQYSVLRVADTGIGIPEDEQDQLFNRFFRSSLAERRAIQGSGLGLSISRAIVEHHGGVIAVHSRQDVGTTVDVRLPIAGGMSNIQLSLDQVERAPL